MKRTATVMIIALLAFGRLSTLSSHWRQQVVADQGGDSGDDSGNDSGDDSGDESE